MNEVLNQSLTEFKQINNNWCKEVGLANMPKNWSTIEKILNLSEEELNLMDRDEKLNTAFTISQYSIFLQMKINRCESFIIWGNRKLNCMFNDDKSKLFNLIEEATIKKTQINFITRRLESLIQTLHLLAKG